MLDGIIQLREKEDERYQSFFEKEIHLLHDSVISESKVKPSCYFLQSPAAAMPFSLICNYHYYPYRVGKMCFSSIILLYNTNHNS